MPFSNIMALSLEPVKYISECPDNVLYQLEEFQKTIHGGSRIVFWLVKSSYLPEEIPHGPIYKREPTCCSFFSHEILTYSFSIRFNCIGLLYFHCGLTINTVVFSDITPGTPWTLSAKNVGTFFHICSPLLKCYSVIMNRKSPENGCYGRCIVQKDGSIDLAG